MRGSTPLTAAALLAVQDHVRSRVSFTAFNITCVLQSSGRRERHDEIKRTVHRLWETGQFGRGYTRTSTVMPDGMRAWLYHPAS